MVARRILLVSILFALGPAARGQNEPAPPKPFRVMIQGDLYVATFSIRRIFDDALREKIHSGLTTRIVVRTQVIDIDEAKVRAIGLSEYRVLYNVWDEDYVVRHWTTLGERAFRLRKYEDVVRRVSRQRRLPLASRDDIPQGGRYQAIVEVEIDPVSDELLAKVRQYLSNLGGHRQEGGGRGLFGNLARIFFDPRSTGTSVAYERRSEPFGAAPPVPAK